MGVSEPAGGDAELAALREELLRRDAAFERDRGEKSSRAHIAADAEWEALYQSLKRAEKALAEASRVSGQCAQYIARRRRFCASRAADGCDGYCSLHAAGLGKSLSRPAAGTKDDADASEPAAANHQTRDGTMDEKTSFSRKKTNVHRRMKKLTNPMALHHRTAAVSPTWSEVYDDLDRPLLIDVGCAKGRFLMRAATSDAARFETSLSLTRENERVGDEETSPANETRHNLLGLEIYAPIVEEALRWTRARDDASSNPGGSARTDGNSHAPKNPRNVHFVACNANVTLTRAWLGETLADRLAYVTILFPDPWSRARHASRRVVTPAFVRALAAVCRENTRVYCCSDVEPLAEEMQATFLNAAHFDGGSPFVLDEASYARHGEATALELKRNASGRGTESGDRLRDAGDADGSRPFNHVFPAHPYEWQNGLGLGADEKNDDDDENDDENGSGSGADLNGFEKCARDDDDAGLRTDRKKRAPTSRARWLAANPMGVPTERDLVCESKWRPVFRFVVARRS